MTKKELKLISSQLRIIERTKVKLSDLRDTLRSQVDDLEDILNSANEANESLEDGIRAFQDAVDELSKFV